MNRYGLHGKLQAKKGKGEELSNILLEASNLVSQLRGCLLYVISRDVQDKDSIWVTEIWESEGDHDNSLKETAVRSIISQAMPLIGATPEKGQELTVLGGHGLKIVH